MIYLSFDAEREKGRVTGEIFLGLYKAPLVCETVKETAFVKDESCTKT